MKKFSTLKTLALAVGMLLTSVGAFAQTADQDTVVTVPETGYLPIKPSRNFTGPKGVAVCSMFGSNSSGLSFTTYGLDSVVVGSSANSSSGLFLIARPGQYTLTLTDAEVTGKINTTSVSWQQEAGQAYKKSRVLYKFVNQPGRVGFERDEKYAADSYQYCDLAEGEHIYLPLAANNVAKAAEKLGTTSAELSFIPWAGPWNKVFTVDDLPEVSQATTATFDFTSASIRENIGTSLTDVKGNVYNETFTVDNVTLQVTSGSAASKIYTDANRGQNLVTYPQYATLTFRAPEGSAITAIEFTAAGNSNINKLTPSSGAVEGMTWTGNADGVRFSQGATSYIAKVVVTLAAKDASTVALPALQYTECANIAAFNALEAGTYAKVTLTDAEVTGVSGDGYSTVWVQDATGGCWIQYTSLNEKLKEKTKLNGYVYVVARPNSGNVQMKEAEATLESQFTAHEITDYTIVEGTLADVNVAANKNKVVKITGATLEETSATVGTLTQGDATIAVNNGAATANQQLHKIADWAKDTKLENVTIVAILVGKSNTENQLLPISVEVVEDPNAVVEVATIADFNAVKDGKTAKLTLTNARVNAYSDLSNVYYIEDATGATAVKGIRLEVGKALNGYLVGTKATEDVDYVNTPSQGYEYSITVDAAASAYETADAELTGTPMTITEACAQANYGRLITLSDINIEPIGNGRNLQLTDANGATMKTRDLFGVLGATYEWPAKATSITGVVLYYMTGWFLIPISESAIVGDATGINSVAAEHTGHAAIYNLQGIRLNSLQKGLNIVNGKKVVVK